MSSKTPVWAQSEGPAWTGHSHPGNCLEIWKEGPAICSYGELPGFSVSASLTFDLRWDKGLPRLVRDGANRGCERGLGRCQLMGEYQRPP